MPNDDTHKPPPEADDTAPKSAPLRWLWKFDHGLDIVKGLSLVTVLSSLAVGYLQYLNAYQDKVGSQAKEDMAAATSTFTEISRAFSEVQALQQALYSDFTRAVRDRSDESDQALVTKNARLISERYEKAQIALRENIDVLTRKAEVYIDWASDTYRDAADKHNVDGDPLSRQVLRDYAFDCSDKYNFPAFGNVHAEDDDDTSVKQVADNEYCAIGEKRGVDDKTKPRDAFITDLRRPQRQGRQANLLVQRQAPRPDDALLLRGRAQQTDARAAMGIKERSGRRQGKGNRRAREGDQRATR